jgi:hypothetical protein
MAEEKKMKLEPGQRFNGLTELAELYQESGMDYYAVLERILLFNNTSCDPPLPLRQVQHVVRSLFKDVELQ